MYAYLDGTRRSNPGGFIGAVRARRNQTENKENFDAGLAAAVENNRLTEGEYRRITGRAYQAAAGADESRGRPRL